ncbi:MAG: D-alanine--D-alanine ligase [Candidatus Caenarcaniphilales bacterium]|nr:D-alanine--D-alanine ligase [Candidatus Caenarcaniphilales bacterium]
MNFKDKRIGVIAGGISTEREISLRSGRNCFEALKGLGYQVWFYDLRSIEDLISWLKAERIEAVFLCTHGTYGEDGKLQGVLDWLKLPYTGSRLLASAVAMNKFYTRQLLQAAGLKVAPGRLLKEGPPYHFPVMVKLIESGSSIGVDKIESQKEYEEFLKLEEPDPDLWFFEDFLPGRELTVGILERNHILEVLPILELRSKKGYCDLESKYSKGMIEFLLPAPLLPAENEFITDIATKSFRTIGCRGYARIDLIMPANHLDTIILELNTLPGMTETSDLPAMAKAAGISFESLVEKMLETCR